MLSYSRTKTSDRLVWRNSLHVLPRNIGRNAFIGYGTTMLRPDGHPVKAEREPVLDMETWETLKAVPCRPQARDQRRADRPSVDVGRVPTMQGRGQELAGHVHYRWSRVCCRNAAGRDRYWGGCDSLLCVARRALYRYLCIGGRPRRGHLRGGSAVHGGR